MKNSLIVHVIANLKSVSILILATPFLDAKFSISSGTPCASGKLPPNLLHLATNSFGTEEEPWRTTGKSYPTASLIAFLQAANLSKSSLASPLNL